MNLNSSTLVASLIWGSLGMGFLVYGKKQTSIPALFGGIALIGVSYFIQSAIYMSLVSIGILAGMYVLTKRG